MSGAVSQLPHTPSLMQQGKLRYVTTLETQLSSAKNKKEMDIEFRIATIELDRPHLRVNVSYRNGVEKCALDYCGSGWGSNWIL